MKREQIVVGAMFRSNGGTGPLTAEVEHISDDGQVRLCRWNGKKRPREYGNNLRQFVLTTDYLLSRRCGWKLMKDTHQ